MIAIKVENISKKYELGVLGAETFKTELLNFFNIKNKRADTYKRDREFWALKNINFEAKQGEVLGIIGKNGAGKSTLLKILSRITAPTTGEIKVRGRIASLLEVGTGFHPELSGRDNIFLNGAILGMTKSEIKSKFNEIVEFSGVEKFIDTPVKRYSSGMYVRLAFGVAAHLEPEILIIDEVLAVGDAEFQKKCLGKMKEVAGEGRTVLFVSHNMTAVNSLCTSCIYLKNGEVFAKGETEKIVNQYITNENACQSSRVWEKGNKPGDEVAILHAARVVDEDLKTIDYSYIDRKTGVEFEYEVLTEGRQRLPNIHVFTSKGENAFTSVPEDNEIYRNLGKHKTIVWIPENILNEGTYIIGIAVSTMDPGRSHFFVQDALVFDVIEDLSKRETEYKQSFPGVVRPKLIWETTKI